MHCRYPLLFLPRLPSPQAYPVPCPPDTSPSSPAAARARGQSPLSYSLSSRPTAQPYKTEENFKMYPPLRNRCMCKPIQCGILAIADSLPPILMTRMLLTPITTCTWKPSLNNAITTICKLTLQLLHSSHTEMHTHILYPSPAKISVVHELYALLRSLGAVKPHRHNSVMMSLSSIISRVIKSIRASMLMGIKVIYSQVRAYCIYICACERLLVMFAN